MKNLEPLRTEILFSARTSRDFGGRYEAVGSITQLEAMQDLGCMRLGARVYDLKHEGYNIRRDMETSKNRYGEDTSYARYRLVE